MRFFSLHAVRHEIVVNDFSGFGKKFPFELLNVRNRFGVVHDVLRPIPVDAKDDSLLRECRKDSHDPPYPTQ